MSMANCMWCGANQYSVPHACTSHTSRKETPMATPCEHRNVRLTDTEEGYECMACGRILGHLFGRHDVYPMGVRELDHPRTGGTFTMRDGREYVVVTPSLILQGVWNSHRSTSRHLYFHVGIGHFIVLESDLLDIAEKGGGPR